VRLISARTRPICLPCLPLGNMTGWFFGTPGVKCMVCCVFRKNGDQNSACIPLEQACAAACTPHAVGYTHTKNSASASISTTHSRDGLKCSQRQKEPLDLNTGCRMPETPSACSAYSSVPLLQYTHTHTHALIDPIQSSTPWPVVLMHSAALTTRTEQRQLGSLS
jgi:hypothetical protein